MTEPDDRRLEAIMGLLPPLLAALETLEHVGRHLHPPRIRALGEAVRHVAVPVRDGLGPLRAVDWPPHQEEARERMEAAAELVLAAYEGLERAGGEPQQQGVMTAYRALRAGTRALEALYPLARDLPPVSRFFVEPALRGDPGILRRVAAPHPLPGTGVSHASNDPDQRGGFSLYVPEYADPSTALPLIVALHGGSGHGGDFLWSWLRTARSMGAILVAPTSRDRTWSLQRPAIDAENLDRIVADVRGRWNIDPERLLLTGMSDGGTFTLLAGLGTGSPFTHLAPCAASFHPGIVDASAPGRLRGLPVYLVHGSLDWMFPVDFAHMAGAALTRAGAKVVLREIEDLSHTYPRDENPRIVDWLMASRG